MRDRVSPLSQPACAVAPHPDALRRLRESVEQLRSANPLVPRSMLRLREPNRPGFNDALVVPGSRMPVGTSLAAARSAARRSVLRGTLNVAVVLVEFSDAPLTTSAEHLRRLFFSTGELEHGSVKEYFQDVSGGLVDLDGQVVGPYRLPLTMAAYANGESGTGVTSPNARTMALHAAEAADPDLDFAPFDNDGDGFVDGLVVVHAGPGAEFTLDGGHIWSHKWVLPDGELVTDTTRLFAYLTVPEDCRIGVCCHELGHLLFGWPDLYDIDDSSSGLGDWCLMASGSWNDGGDNPAHPSAWCKAEQGWVTVVNQAARETVDIADVKESRVVHRLWKDAAPGTEYFLLENRQRAGYDADLPGEGLLIYHVDDTIGTNADEAHYRVGLLQADGKRDLERGANQGDDGDAYPGRSGNRSFGPTTTPSSHSYAGVATSVSVTDVGPPGGRMRATLSVSSSGRPPVARPLIRRGSRGPHVEHLQRTLAGLGFDPGPVDGIFGAGTASAVRTYQRSRGLVADGVVGPQTWRALDAEG